jgi:hypothetical protein
LHRDGLDDAVDGLLAKGGDAGGHDRHSTGRVLSKFVDDLGIDDTAGRQYSSASMTVITRTVTTGSVGSGDRYFRFRSK